MPYIHPYDRTKVVQSMEPQTAGELNYLVTRITLDFLYRKGPPRYQDMNDALGALEGCKLELYRRLVGPYEDQKIAENGDVYPPIFKDSP